MADFCRQCAEALYGKDERYLNDCSGMVEEFEVKEGFTAGAICERCGIIRVDHDGKCVDINCSIHKKEAFEYWKLLGLDPLKCFN